MENSLNEAEEQEMDTLMYWLTLETKEHFVDPVNRHVSFPVVIDQGGIEQLQADLRKEGIEIVFEPQGNGWSLKLAGTHE